MPAIVKYHALSAELKVLSWYLFISAASNLVTNVLGMSGINNMPIFHVYTFIELAILSIFYRKVFGNTGPGRYVPGLILSFFVLCVVNVLFFQNIHTYNTYTKSAEAIVIIALSLAYFKKNLDLAGGQTDGKSVVPYVNSGLLIYFSGSFILFIIPNMILHAPQLFGNIIWTVHGTLVLIMYLLFATALWKYKK